MVSDQLHTCSFSSFHSVNDCFHSVCTEQQSVSAVSSNRIHRSSFIFFLFSFVLKKGISRSLDGKQMCLLFASTPPRPRPTQSKLELLTTPRLGPPSINSRASHTHFLEGSNLRDMDMETSTEEVKGTTLIEFTSSRVVHESP